MSGTVGLERPRAIGAWFKGVFWGVGAVIFEPVILRLDDIVNGEEEQRKSGIICGQSSSGVWWSPNTICVIFDVDVHVSMIMYIGRFHLIHNIQSTYI